MQLITFAYGLMAVNSSNSSVELVQRTLLSNSSSPGTNYSGIAKSTAKASVATFGIWKTLSSIAKFQGKMILGTMLSDFPEFKKYLHSITSDISDEEKYKFLLAEFNKLVIDSSGNRLQLNDAPELMTWIRDTEEGTNFVVHAVLNKYKNHLESTGNNAALNKWKNLAERLNLQDANKVVESHYNYVPGISSLEHKSARAAGLTIPQIVNQRLDKIEDPGIFKKLRNLWINIPNKRAIMKIAGSIVGGSIITVMLMRRFKERRQNMKNEPSI